MALFVSVAALAARCPPASAALFALLVVLVLALGHGQMPVHSSLPDQHTLLSFPSVLWPSFLDPKTCTVLVRRLAPSVKGSCPFLS